MLRLYTPIQHDIFTLHNLLEKVVCEVWCAACEDSCDSKLEQAFKDISHYTYKGRPLIDEVERIYNKFKIINRHQKKLIISLFKTSQLIEELCISKVYNCFMEQPSIIENEIKPLFRWCYETLLEKGKVMGDKMDYYNKLIEHSDNDFDTCPCCGLIDIESSDSICREDYDHYLPKAHYPFASVNFLNLVPICNKCNRDRKKAKDPIENDRITFYPFSTDEHNIEINLNFTVDINKEGKELNFTDLKINLTGQADKIETWDWLFDIATRYEDKIKTFSKRFLKEIKSWHKIFNEDNAVWTYDQTINRLISQFEPDYYDDKKFLKIAFLKAIKNDAEFMSVYE